MSPTIYQVALRSRECFKRKSINLKIIFKCYWLIEHLTSIRNSLSLNILNAGGLTKSSQIFFEKSIKPMHDWNVWKFIVCRHIFYSLLAFDFGSHISICSQKVTECHQNQYFMNLYFKHKISQTSAKKKWKHKIINVLQICSTNICNNNHLNHLNIR